MLGTKPCSTGRQEVDASYQRPSRDSAYSYEV